MEGDRNSGCTLSACLPFSRRGRGRQRVMSSCEPPLLRRGIIAPLHPPIQGGVCTALRWKGQGREPSVPAREIKQCALQPCWVSDLGLLVSASGEGEQLTRQSAHAGQRARRVAPKLNPNSLHSSQQGRRLQVGAGTPYTSGGHIYHGDSSTS